MCLEECGKSLKETALIHFAHSYVYIQMEIHIQYLYICMNVCIQLVSFCFVKIDVIVCAELD